MSEYRALQCVDCAVGFSALVGVIGAPRRRCTDCSPSQAGKPTPSKARPTRKVCAGCAAEFVGRPHSKYCSYACKVKIGNERAKVAAAKVCETCSAGFCTDRRNKSRWCSTECKPKALRGLFSCLGCGCEYKRRPQATGQGEKYCSRECFFSGIKRAESPAVCAYHTGKCETCLAWIGSRRPRKQCATCCRQAALERGRDAARQAGAAIHRAAAAEKQCPDCGGVFCPTYGHSLATCCSECSIGRKRQCRKAAKAVRRAKLRGATTETVIAQRVFARDGWRCRFCGINTPEALRGTQEHNAPELDHVVPLARGGQHSYDNTQCLCRACNGFKSDRTMAELEQVLAG